MSEILEQDSVVAEKDNIEQNSQMAAEDFRMVTFSLGHKAYGIDIMQVKEISSAKRFTYVPNTASFVRGVFNLRGEIIPVLDMRLFFHLEITGERSELDVTRNNEIYEDLIILTFGYINIGIIVDSISHVVSIDRCLIQRSHPLFWELEVQYIEGIVDYKDQLYIILAMDQIIDPHLDSSNSTVFDLEATFTAIAQMQALKQEAMPGSALQLSILGAGSKTEEQTADTSQTPAELPTQVLQETESLSQNVGQDIGPSTGQAGRTRETEESEHSRSVQGATDSSERSNRALEETRELNPSELLPSASLQAADEQTEDSLDLNLDGLSQNQKALAKALVQEGLVISKLNAASIEQKWREWRRSKNIDVPNEEVLDSLHNRKEFVQLLKSKEYNRYWSAGMGQAVQRHLGNRSGNLNVWHAGCGNGQETYSLTASLIQASPEANLQVRAADAELLEVAEAPLQNVGAPSELPEWLRPYLNDERGNNGYTFSKALKDRIIFEYQDVVHASSHTKADLIVMRDLLSRCPETDQKYVLRTIDQVLKDDGFLVIGDNEDLDPELWELIEREPLKIYRRKDRER